MYDVEYTPKAIKQLEKLDSHTRKLIYDWIGKNLVGCTNPRQHGKGLTANHSGEWRYRVGDYRIVANIVDEEITILVVNVAHRSTVYKN